MSDPLRWSILGTGRIARKFAEGVAASDKCRVVAVGSRSAESAREFGETFDIETTHGSYELAVADPQVQAVYISLPNHLHARYSILAAEAGKHVLCEKPLAMNAVEAETVVETARRCGTFLMEAFMYRCHPQIAQLKSLLQERAVGDVRHIRASFAYDAGPRPDDIRNDRAMGGGGIMDVGCYCASGARLIAGAVDGKDFIDPTEVAGSAAFPDGVDVDQWAVAALKFPGEITAELVCGMQLQDDWQLRIYGTTGVLELTDPWFGKEPMIIVQRNDRDEPETIDCRDQRSPYQLEADVVAEHLADGQAPAMSWADSLGNMQTLDKWRASAGLHFPGDAPPGRSEPRRGA